jgi:hypothetical protein
MENKNLQHTSFEGSAAQHNVVAGAMISRDEMNLAEFPLTVLSTRVDSKLKTLEFRDIITGKSGKPIAREWIITGADKFGLPTASDDEVLLGLLKLTVNDGFQSEKVYFTRYELLQILRWTTEGRSYSRLQKALDRLSGVRIKATNAFYDNESKSHSTKNFGIIDAYEINDGRDLATKKSFFIWSAEIFKSFQAGFIKKLDLDFYQKLSSAIAKRLYRYLDKNFWYRSKLTINLFTLAHEKIGVSRNYKFTSSIRQQLDPALEELKAAGFVQSYEYQGKGKGTEIVISAGLNKPRCHAGPENSIAQNNVVESDRFSDFRRQTANQNVPTKSLNNGEVSAQDLCQILMDRGLSAVQAQRIALDSGAQRRARIRAIVEYFDDMMKSQGANIKSPVGFLYRAVSQPEKFVLPTDNSSVPREAKAPSGKEQGKIVSSQKRLIEQTKLQEEYFAERERELDRLMNMVEPQVLNRVESEVILSLNKLVGVLSQDRLQQSIVHGVRQKVGQLFALPTFEEWKASR